MKNMVYMHNSCLTYLPFAYAPNKPYHQKMMIMDHRGCKGARALRVKKKSDLTDPWWYKECLMVGFSLLPLHSH